MRHWEQWYCKFWGATYFLCSNLIHAPLQVCSGHRAFVVQPPNHHHHPSAIYIKPDSSAVSLFSFPYRFPFFSHSLQMTAAEQADPVFEVPKRLLNGELPKPHIVGFDEYKKLWEQSVNDPDTFFGNVSIII